jgi:hypothetical protein
MLTWSFGPQITMRSTILYQLPVSKKVPVSVSFVDSAGNPALIDGVPVWESSDASKVTLDVAADGLSAFVLSAGPIGTAQVSVKADAKMGPDIKEIIGLLDVEIVAGEAVTVVLNPGEAVDQ